MINNLQEFEDLIKLMVKYKLDEVKVNGVEIIKNKHDFVKTESTTPITKKTSLSDDELMMYSSSAPSLTPEQIEALSYSSKPLKLSKDKK